MSAEGRMMFEQDAEGVEMKGSVFNHEAKMLNYVSPDPVLA